MSSSQQTSACSRWSTASIGERTGTSPMELSDLHDHLDQCNASCGRLFALQGAAESFNAFVVRRPVTIWIAALVSLIVVTRLL